MKSGSAYTLIILLMLSGCKSFEERTYASMDSNMKRMNVPYMGSFSVPLNNNIHDLNEIRYNNGGTALYTKKVMFDKFGMWDEEIMVEEESRLSVLVWKNKRLISGIEENFTVIASSMEGYDGMFGSFMVVDNNKKDQLKEAAPFRKELIFYLTNLLRTNDYSDNRFFEVYQSRKN